MLAYLGGRVVVTQGCLPSLGGACACFVKNIFCPTKRVLVDIFSCVLRLSEIFWGWLEGPPQMRIVQTISGLAVDESDCTTLVVHPDVAVRSTREAAGVSRLPIVELCIDRG